MFATLSDRLADTFKNLRGKGRLSEADIDATAREIRIALLEADVALPVVKEFVAAVKERARGEEVSGALNPAQQIVKIVNEELVTILGGETRRLRYAKTGPTVIMLAGLQGAGKTTLAAKLALWLKEQGKQPAARRRRPAAPQRGQPAPGQRRAGRRTGLRPRARQRRRRPGRAWPGPSIEEAKRTLHDVVIVDTAGRLGVDAEMMQQAADIRDAVNPDEILFVVDAMIGQDAVNTAQAFLDGVGYDGVVLTKLDGDARGGAALSIASITGKPVMFASAGEKMTDFDLFHPDRMASRILDMGDMLTLIEQAEKTFDQDQAAKAAAKLSGQGGEFTLDDFLEQMQQVRKLGSMSKIMGMLPGMGQFREQLENFDEREIDRIQAIIQSMTPAERANPKMIDGSRRRPHREGLRPPGLRRQHARRPLLRGPQDDDVDGPRRRHAGHARDAGDARHGRQAPEGQGAAQEGQGRQALRQPGQGGPAGRGGQGEGRLGQPVRDPRRPGHRLRAGRRRARPAQGLLQVPEVTVLLPGTSRR